MNVFVCQCVGGGRGNIDWGGGADVIIPVLSACLITCLNVRHISHQPSRTPTQVSKQKKITRMSTFMIYDFTVRKVLKLIFQMANL